MCILCILLGALGQTFRLTPHVHFSERGENKRDQSAEDLGIQPRVKSLRSSYTGLYSQRGRDDDVPPGDTFAHLSSSSSAVLLSSLVLSDTKVYEPYTRARLGTAAHFCEVVVLKLTS